jgi:hypothetical protein
MRDPSTHCCPQAEQFPTDEATPPDGDATALVRRYVLVHEHSTGRAQTSRHIGYFHAEVTR